MEEDSSPSFFPSLQHSRIRKANTSSRLSPWRWEIKAKRHTERDFVLFLNTWEWLQNYWEWHWKHSGEKKITQVHIQTPAGSTTGFALYQTRQGCFLSLWMCWLLSPARQTWGRSRSHERMGTHCSELQRMCLLGATLGDVKGFSILLTVLNSQQSLQSGKLQEKLI